MKSTCCHRHDLALTRREALLKSGGGLGAMALAWLLDRDGALAAAASAGSPSTGINPLAPKQPHFSPKAKCVISLFMQGGPSQMDTFDPKPELTKLDGKPLPASFKSEDLKLQFMSAAGATLMGSPFPFKKHGQSGLEISDLFPNLSRFADELAVIRSCYHESFIHGPALSLMHSGNLLLGHPSVGSWVVSGLGCESDSLPAFMVMTDGVIRGSSSAYSSGFLPAVYQGTLIRTEGAAIQNLAPPPQITPPQQRTLIDQIGKWNQSHLASREDDTNLAARIANYELAFRMQAAAPDLIDVSQEPKAILEAYGTDKEPTARFGRMCLLARRMVERGVRFVELYGNDWDGHGDCPGNHKGNADKTDKPIAALLADLDERGLLDSTLVLWSGEFGRTPIMQGNKGRDHNPYGFTAWLAGGGVQGGKAIGATDEFGFRAVDDKVHVHDLHATMLTLLGLDHEKLTYLFEGRMRRLTDVGGQNDLAERLVKS
ncbi:MAG: DUF1501 domain-containing protein [Planctomycetia bacterium]|nr:DUF1501 domain-containing protein [Planctomycetia bacterium]